MNRDAFERELTQMGILVRVEAWDRLAVLIPDSMDSAQAIEAFQRHVPPLASKHGFSHVAIELTEDWCSGASLPRRQSD